MVNDVDLLILGRGCAGLSLAWCLSELGIACPRVLILKQRTVHTNERTWCFWDNRDARVADLLAKEWRWLNLSASARTIRFDCGPNPCHMLAAFSFYDSALKAIGKCQAITLALGESVTTPLSEPSGVWVLATNRRQIKARWVVDTRPSESPVTPTAALWQSFYGHEVFNPEAAEMMEFTARVDGQIRFSYILPVSKNRALIETAVFGAVPLERAALTVQLNHAVNQYAAGSPFSVVCSESGILPMRLIRTPSSLGPGHVVVRMMVGSVRASSGFAFSAYSAVGRSMLRRHGRRWANYRSPRRPAFGANDGPPFPASASRIVTGCAKLVFILVRAGRQRFHHPFSIREKQCQRLSSGDKSAACEKLCAPAVCAFSSSATRALRLTP